MAVKDPTDPKSLLADKAELSRRTKSILAELGLPAEPTMTAEELQQSLLDSGIRPENKELTTDLLRMRYGDDWERVHRVNP